ncbi:hypothetical protein UB51_08840 [Paenibacillus sp. IHBB 10380]|nr:hypothetical protein UB51_08840 [Paenibacillus sp. IHBB 10380]
MKYRLITKNDKSYIMCDEIKICSEQDILDIISACFGNKIYSLIIDGNTLSEDFYDLKTKLLGMALQKFIIYNIKVVFIIEKERTISDRFKELVLEINKGDNFRVFYSVEDAEKWLLR